MNPFIVKQLRGKPYRIFLPLFWIVIIGLLGLSVYGLSLNDWSLKSQIYAVCDDPNGCFNPFFGSPSCDYSVYGDFCLTEHMFFGQEFGVKPPWFIVWINEWTFGSIFAWLLLNHFLFNRGFFRGVKDELRLE